MKLYYLEELFIIENLKLTVYNRKVVLLNFVKTLINSISTCFKLTIFILHPLVYYFCFIRNMDRKISDW